MNYRSVASLDRLVLEWLCRLPRDLDVIVGVPRSGMLVANLLALHVGALIYLGTFAVANNFDYRLVFLLLTFPQLIEWACMPEHRLSRLALATLVAIVVLLWVGSLSQWLNLWDELASWAVAGLLAAVVAATVPGLDAVRKSVYGGVALTDPTT